MEAKVKIIKEVPDVIHDGEWHLYFQKCEWCYKNGNTFGGYRFIWRRPDGSLQPARGQARILSKKDILQLIEMAEQAGFFQDNY